MSLIYVYVWVSIYTRGCWKCFVSTNTQNSDVCSLDQLIIIIFYVIAILDETDPGSPQLSTWNLLNLKAKDFLAKCARTRTQTHKHTNTYMSVYLYVSVCVSGCLHTQKGAENSRFNNDAILKKSDFCTFTQIIIKIFYLFYLSRTYDDHGSAQLPIWYNNNINNNLVSCDCINSMIFDKSCLFGVNSKFID